MVVTTSTKGKRKIKTKFPVARKETKGGATNATNASGRAVAAVVADASTGGTEATVAASTGGAAVDPRKPVAVDFSLGLDTIKEEEGSEARAEAESNIEVEMIDEDKGEEGVVVESAAAAKTPADARTTVEAEAAAKLTADAALMSIERASIAAAASSPISNAATAPASSLASVSSLIEDDTGKANKGDEDSILEVKEPELEVSKSFTTDEDLCLKYFFPYDTDQPMGKRGRFTREDLASFIVSTKKMYCLLIAKPPGLQLLHSAFMWKDWVYASASTREVDDYWIRIPMKELLKPMAGLNFRLWQTKGLPALGQKMLTIKSLANRSLSLLDFLSNNKLKEVPVSVTKKESRPGSSTIISGALYTLLVQHVGSTEGEPGFFVKTNDALLALQEWADFSESNLDYDYLVYFLLATPQGLNPEIDGLEYIKLKEMEDIPSIVAHRAWRNWDRFYLVKTCPPEPEVQGGTTNSPLPTSTGQAGRDSHQTIVDLSQPNSPEQPLPLPTFLGTFPLFMDHQGSCRGTPSTFGVSIWNLAFMEYHHRQPQLL